MFGEVISVFVFQLGERHFALTSDVIHKITSLKPIHSIPDQCNLILQGLVNLDGKLEPCIYLQELLDPTMQPSFHQMMAMIQDSEIWVFPITKALGSYRIPFSAFQEIPFEFSILRVNYIRGHFLLDQTEVSLLDESLLFSALNRGA